MKKKEKRKKKTFFFVIAFVENNKHSRSEIFEPIISVLFFLLLNVMYYSYMFSILGYSFKLQIDSVKQ